MYGKQAESSSQYLAKGRSAYVEGSLRTRSWEKNGEKRYATEIVAERVQFPGGGGERGAASSSAEAAGGMRRRRCRRGMRRSRSECAESFQNPI